MAKKNKLYYEDTVPAKDVAYWNVEWAYMVGRMANELACNQPKKRHRALSKLLWKHAKAVKPEAFRGGN